MHDVPFDELPEEEKARLLAIYPLGVMVRVIDGAFKDSVGRICGHAKGEMGYRGPALVILENGLKVWFQAASLGTEATDAAAEPSRQAQG